MRYLRPGETIDLVWSLDDDVDLVDDERREPVTGADGEPATAGRMLPALEVQDRLRPGAVIWSIRPLSAVQYAGITAATRNHEIARMGTVRASGHLCDESWEGAALGEFIDLNGLSLTGDLAAAIWRASIDPTFRARAIPRPGVG